MSDVADRSISATAWLITIHDKEIHGEPDVGMAVVQGDERAARDTATALEEEMRSSGRCRCVATIRDIQLGRGYRIGSLIRIRT